MVGHSYHFQGPELASELQELGCEIVQLRRWGFPIHSLYKILINKLSPEKLYGSFSETHYGFLQDCFRTRCICSFISMSLEFRQSTYPACSQHARGPSFEQSIIMELRTLFQTLLPVELQVPTHLPRRLLASLGYFGFGPGLRPMVTGAGFTAVSAALFALGG